jgi:hypothetical protein
MKRLETYSVGSRIVGLRRSAWLLGCAALVACSSSKPSLMDESSISGAGAPSPIAGAGQTSAGAGAGAGSAGSHAQSATDAGTSTTTDAAAGSAGSSHAADSGAGAGGTTPNAGGGGSADMSTSAGASGTAGSAGVTAAGPPPTAADFTKLGPYGKAMRLLNQGKGTISGGSMGTIGEGGDDASAFTLLFPSGVKAGEHLPLLTWGNGTFCSPTLYDQLFDHIVSYGYVIIATNTSNAGMGTEMLKAVDWALAESAKADSPIHDLVDKDKIGAFGHSQGGEGAVKTGADPRIKALAPLSAGPMGNGEAMIQCPTFYTLTANDVVTPDSYRASYDATKTPSVYGVTSGGDHMEYTDKADGLNTSGLTSNDAQMTRSAITAWFEWQLKGKNELQPLFIGKDCGFCKDSNWKSFESKGF